MCKFYTLGLACFFLIFAGSPGFAEQAASPGSPAGKPNIVFILVDDFAMNLLPFMLQSPYYGLRGMVNKGAVFANYFVSNSLC